MEVNDTDMKKKIETTTFIGFLFAVLSGTLLHFAFQASGGDLLVAALAPVNESIWEHLKLLLTPTIVYGVLEYFVFGKDCPSFFAGKIVSIIMGMLFIVCGYYTYTGILGQHYLGVDIGLFIAASALTYRLTYLFCISNRHLTKESQSIAALLMLTVILLAFIYFTYHPPMLEIFRDPVTEDFGILSALRYPC